MRSVTFIHAMPSLASYRYRAAMPAKEIGAMVNDVEAEIIVVSKPWDYAKIVPLKEEGKTIVVDFCDDHFNHPEHGQMYHDFAKLADYCVCPTEEMRKRIPSDKVAIIPDPYEMEELEPHAFGDKLLWFGHPVNLKALEPYRNLPNLTVVSLGPGVVQYSHETLVEEMKKANIAIFPVKPWDGYKSPNRVVNSLRMGLFPVCHHHLSYVEFKRFLWQSDIPTGLKWAAEFRHDLNDLVKAGQDYIRDRYSPKTIGAKWKDLLESI